DSVSPATPRRRFPKSRSKIPTHNSPDLYRRMRQCQFLAAEKGIRPAAQTRAVRDRAAQSDAGVIETRTEQPSESGKTLRQARDRFRTVNRSASERQLDGVGCRSCADRA